MSLGIDINRPHHCQENPFAITLMNEWQSLYLSHGYHATSLTSPWWKLGIEIVWPSHSHENRLAINLIDNHDKYPEDWFTQSTKADLIYCLTYVLREAILKEDVPDHESQFCLHEFWRKDLKEINIKHTQCVSYYRVGKWRFNKMLFVVKPSIAKSFDYWSTTDCPQQTHKPSQNSGCIFRFTPWSSEENNYNFFFILNRKWIDSADKMASLEKVTNIRIRWFCYINNCSIE